MGRHELLHHLILRVREIVLFIWIVDVCNVIVGRSSPATWGIGGRVGGAGSGCGGGSGGFGEGNGLGPGGMGPGSGPGLGFGVAAFAIHIIISLNSQFCWMCSQSRGLQRYVPYISKSYFFRPCQGIFLNRRLKTCDVTIWLPSIFLHSSYQDFSEMPPCQPALGRSENRMCASVTPSRWIQETVQTLHRSIVQ